MTDFNSAVKPYLPKLSSLITKFRQGDTEAINEIIKLYDHLDGNTVPFGMLHAACPTDDPNDDLYETCLKLRHDQHDPKAAVVVAAVEETALAYEAFTTALQKMQDAIDILS